MPAWGLDNGIATCEDTRMQNSTTTAAHEIAIARRNNRWSVATCTCGWQSKSNILRAPVERDANAHVEQAA